MSTDCGGGIKCWYTSPTIACNTIVGNSADTGAGGIDGWSGSPDILNTLVAFNSSGVKAYSGLQITNCVYGNADYDYYWIDPTGTYGNISVDPLFVIPPTPGSDGLWGTDDDDYGNLHLAAGSPCINAADTHYEPTSDETDVDGQPRTLYGQIDIGADEYQFAGDVNFDAYVNVGDLQGLVAAWGSQKADPSSSWSAGRISTTMAMLMSATSRSS